MLSIVLPIALGLQAALSAQAMTAHPRGAAHDEAGRLAAAIEASFRASMSQAALQGAKFQANYVPNDDSLDELKAADDAEAEQRVRRSAEAGADARDVEEVTEAGEEDCDCGEDGQPPATGIRRWVIRIRNVMFGRRDLEGTEDGEAEGEPETGRTWVESLAHWFAHGIKNFLIRIGGGSPEEGGEAPENVAVDVAASGEQGPPATPSPSPTPGPGRSAKRRPAPAPAPGTSTSATSTARSVPAPSPSTPMPWTALPPVAVPSDAEAEADAPSGPTAKPRAEAPAGTVYDDEAFGDEHRVASGPAVETNELN